MAVADSAMSLAATSAEPPEETVNAGALPVPESAAEQGGKPSGATCSQPSLPRFWAVKVSVPSCLVSAPSVPARVPSLRTVVYVVCQFSASTSCVVTVQSPPVLRYVSSIVNVPLAANTTLTGISPGLVLADAPAGAATTVASASSATAKRRISPPLPILELARIAAFSCPTPRRRCPTSLRHLVK
jgi:hypothetical protein